MPDRDHRRAAIDQPLPPCHMDALDPVTCREFWVACLVENLRCAFGAVRPPEHGEERLARLWIGSDGFAEVCFLAGVDPDSMADWYHKNKKSGQNPLLYFTTYGGGARQQIEVRGQVEQRSANADRGFGEYSRISDRTGDAA